MRAKTQHRSRKPVEIYFVLYLAALVLLIPSKDKNNKNDNHKDNSVFSLDFALKTERPTLNCILGLDSSGVKILTHDSINHIYFTGDVTNVQFEFSIEDQTLKQKATITGENNDKSNSFRIEQNNTDQYATFHWLPKIVDYTNKTYLVQVIAKANLKSNPNEIVVRKTQFGLNLTFNNQMLQSFADNNNLMNPNTNQFQNIPTVQYQAGNIILFPQMDVIKTVAYAKWDNTINISGMNPKNDLLKQPVIQIIKEAKDGSGSAVIKSYNESWIQMEGTAPSYGSMKVKLSLARKIDGQEKTIEFNIENQMLGEPNLEKILYPGFNYKINPNLPFLSQQTTKAVLKYKDGGVLATSNEGNVFNYTPNSIDTGKYIELIRYIDNHEIGQRFYGKVSNFPNPEIYRVVETDKNKIRLLTNSYGTFNGNENFITKIDIIEGNARVREIFGSKQNSNNNFKISQVFEIVPYNNENTFKFKARAVSANGQKSQIITYP